jgi:hypothetical protein
MKPELNENNLQSTVSELRLLFRNLSPEDNVNGFLWTGTIAALEETIIPSKMLDRSKAKYFIVLNIKGTANLVKGDREWTESFVSLKNADASNSLTATVLFFK